MTWSSLNRNCRSFVAYIHSFLLGEPVACLLFVLLCIIPMTLFLYYLQQIISKPPQIDNNQHAISLLQHAMTGIQQSLPTPQPLITDLQSAIQELQKPSTPKPIFPMICSYKWGFIFASVAGIFALFLSGFHSSHFLLNVSKWIRQIIKPLSIGAFIGFLLIAFYFLLLEKTNAGSISYDSVMVSALGIYLTVCGLFVGFHGVFFEKIPILDIETLMEEMTYDIKECRRRICWSFPGLSFGSISVAGPLYDEFHSALEDKMVDITCDTRFFVLSEEEIIDFYSPYEHKFESIQNNDERNYFLERVKIARDHSLKLLKRAKDCESDSFILGGCKRYNVDHDFRHQIIIIDSSIYFLHSIGLPKKIEGVWDFTSEDHVNFIATKLVNGSLAGSLCNIIREEYETIKKKKNGGNKNA